MRRDEIDLLPETPLMAPGVFAAWFRERGIQTVRDAARYLRGLPYGRTSERGDPMLVLSERRGTCSTKHAVLAKLAEEQGLEIVLTLGIFSMSQANTPGVGPVLESYDLPEIPEAHCYVTYRGQRIDITSAPNEPAPAARVFSHEEPITPEQIEECKPRRHREFLAAWIADGGGGGRSLDEVWKIREECIAAMSSG